MEKILTRDEAVERFRAHWRDISEASPLTKNSPYMRRFEQKYGSTLTRCFLCEFVTQIQGNEGGCEKCPIDWKVAHCGEPDSLFLQWGEAVKAHQEALAAAIALEISKLPTKSEGSDG